MAKFTFYGGAGEIGGSKILLEERKAKVYLDFGESFDFGSDYFFDYLSPRKVNGLEAYSEFGLMPKVRKLYSESFLRFSDVDYESPDIDAVFISHHHSDHTGHLPFLDESIPVYMGHGTRKVMEIYRDLYPQFSKLGAHEELNLFKSGDNIPIKHLNFRPIHVEHSTPGAYGFVIEREDGNIVYTGDFRRHGPKQEYTEEFITEAAKSKPEVMFCEGTRMTPDPENRYSEKQVYDKVKGIIQSAEGLVFVNFAMCNVDRFKSVYKATIESGRKFVVDLNMAYLMDNLREKIPDLPDPKTDPNMMVYFRLEKTCTFCEKDYGVDDRKYMDNMITYRELRKTQGEYVMLTNFNKLMELVYIRPEKAEYIYSSSEHFLEGEDNEEMRSVLEKWLDHFKINLHKAHCSGHASKSDLEYAIKKIKPDILIPIHTQNPEEFKKIHDNVKIPEKGKTINLK